ncbi:MAG TPA: carbohydrate-binding protein [Polyangia bacterium]|nr:carbohydrate-binding protein [Polyangia bacterium]
MKTELTQRVGLIGTALGLAAILGCSPPDADATGTEAAADALSTTNGLADINGLTSYNGLMSYNGLSAYNGLTSYNGLPSTSGPMTTADGRQTISYLVRCALASGDTLVKQDQFGNSYTFAGGFGLAPQYKNGACDTDCQEMISSCMLAHINTSGTHIPLWIVGPMAAVGWGQSAWYPTREGTFFGNIFQPDSSGKVRAHYCTASTVLNDTVPGRLGVNQNGAPYTNPYAGSGYCDSSCTMGGASGKIDGAASCPADGRTWTHPLTVWRGQTFQAETGTLSGAATPVACANCSQGRRVGYINSTSGVVFNNVRVSTSGSQNIVVYFTNGDTKARNFNISVNGGAAQRLSFPVVSAGNWTVVSNQTIALSGFVTGSTNNVKFLADGSNAAPDLDWIEVMPSGGFTVEAETGLLTGTAQLTVCPSCSYAWRVGYFGPNSSMTLKNINTSTSGTHAVTVYYTSGDTVSRSISASVNGGATQLFSGVFPPTGSWDGVKSATFSLGGFTAGSNNTIKFSTDGSHSAPDIDFVQVN